MTPHLAQNDESPQDLQNLQSITAAASTSTATAALSIAAIATIAGATTTAPIIGKVGVADPVDDESAKENHGNGKVGDANLVDDESAKEDHGDGKVGATNLLRKTMVMLKPAMLILSMTNPTKTISSCPIPITGLSRVLRDWMRKEYAI